MSEESYCELCGENGHTVDDHQRRTRSHEDEPPPIPSWIPDDTAMYLRKFELVVYIDNDGHEQIEWKRSGEPVTGMAALGYLEAAKAGMYHSQLHGDDDD